MIEDILSILSNTLIYMVPILLASVGEIINEKSGVVNIGLEGILTLAAFVATVITFMSGKPLLGLITGLLVGTCSGVLHGIISVYLRGDQIISGIGFNIFAYGISVMGLVTIWQQHGASPPVNTLPTITLIGKYYLSPLTIIALAITVIIWYWLFKTSSGLKLRACGEEPHAAEAMGVNVLKVRFLATVFGATLTGLGGAYLAVGWIGQFTRAIAAGRGFIALANVAFSNWNPILAILGSFIFGFFDVLSTYLQIKVQAIALTYPLKALPYIGTLVIVALFIGRTRMPRALAKPYIKE